MPHPSHQNEPGAAQSHTLEPHPREQSRRTPFTKYPSISSRQSQTINRRWWRVNNQQPCLSLQKTARNPWGEGWGNHPLRGTFVLGNHRFREGLDNPCFCTAQGVKLKSLSWHPLVPESLPRPFLGRAGITEDFAWTRVCDSPRHRHVHFIPEVIQTLLREPSSRYTFAANNPGPPWNPDSPWPGSRQRDSPLPLGITSHRAASIPPHWRSPPPVP
jgi:hypothetical protein